MSPGDDIAPTCWPRQRWVLTILILFVGQCSVVYFLAQPPPFPAARQPSHSQTILAALVEPTFGSVHPLGLPAIPTALQSRELRARENQSIPYPLDDGSPIARGLGIATRAEQLGHLPPISFPNWSNTLESLPELPGAKPAQIRPASRTVSRVIGNLRSRKLVGSIPVLDWTSPEPLQPTVTEVMVNASGFVISEKLIEPSGNRTADALALEASRRVRFENLDGVKASAANHPSNLVWGRILFQWGVPNPDEPANR
jgi:hypothetical protein